MKLTMYQQRALHVVTDAASRQGGKHVTRMRNGTICEAQRCGEFPFFTVKWRVISPKGKVITEGRF